MPPTMNKKPVVLAMKTGNIGEPTTFFSVRPLPGNCVCFWRTSKKRCTLTSPMMTSGTIRQCKMKKRGMINVPGKLPPKIQKARYVPTNGTERMIEYAMRMPVPETRSSGSE